MGITALSGPVVSFGVTLSTSGSDLEHNDQRGPSVFDLGNLLADPRPNNGYAYAPGQGPTADVVGWLGSGQRGVVIDQAPTPQSSNGIALSQSATGNANLVLATSANSSNVSAVTIIPATGSSAVSVLAIDGAATLLSFGPAGAINVWNPGAALSRVLTITSSVNDSGGAYTIRGYDLYGFALTCTVTGPNNTTVTTPKAFKYIASIGSSGTIASTGVYIGVTDNFGLPLRCDHPGYVEAWAGLSSVATLLSTSGGYLTVGSTRSTQTSTTPDVRGIFTSTSVIGSTVSGYRVVVLQSVSAANLAATTSTNVAFLGPLQA